MSSRRRTERSDIAQPTGSKEQQHRVWHPSQTDSERPRYHSSTSRNPAADPGSSTRRYAEEKYRSSARANKADGYTSAPPASSNYYAPSSYVPKSSRNEATTRSSNQPSQPQASTSTSRTPSASHNRSHTYPQPQYSKPLPEIHDPRVYLTKRATGASPQSSYEKISSNDEAPRVSRTSRLRHTQPTNVPSAMTVPAAKQPSKEDVLLMERARERERRRERDKYHAKDDAPVGITDPISSTQRSRRPPEKEADLAKERVRGTEADAAIQRRREREEANKRKEYDEQRRDRERKVEGERRERDSDNERPEPDTSRRMRESDAARSQRERDRVADRQHRERERETNAKREREADNGRNRQKIDMELRRRKELEAAQASRERERLRPAENQPEKRMEAVKETVPQREAITRREKTFSPRESQDARGDDPDSSDSGMRRPPAALPSHRRNRTEEGTSSTQSRRRQPEAPQSVVPPEILLPSGSANTNALRPMNSYIPSNAGRMAEQGQVPLPQMMPVYLPAREGRPQKPRHDRTSSLPQGIPQSFPPVIEAEKVRQRELRRTANHSSILRGHRPEEPIDGLESWSNKPSSNAAELAGPPAKKWRESRSFIASTQPLRTYELPNANGTENRLEPSGVISSNRDPTLHEKHRPVAGPQYVSIRAGQDLSNPKPSDSVHKLSTPSYNNAYPSGTTSVRPSKSKDQILIPRNTPTAPPISEQVILSTFLAAPTKHSQDESNSMPPSTGAASYTPRVEESIVLPNTKASSVQADTAKQSQDEFVSTRPTTGAVAYAPQLIQSHASPQTKVTWVQGDTPKQLPDESSLMPPITSAAVHTPRANESRVSPENKVAAVLPSTLPDASRQSPTSLQPKQDRTYRPSIAPPNMTTSRNAPYNRMSIAQTQGVTTGPSLQHPTNDEKAPPGRSIQVTDSARIRMREHPSDSRSMKKLALPASSHEAQSQMYSKYAKASDYLSPTDESRAAPFVPSVGPALPPTLMVAQFSKEDSKDSILISHSVGDASLSRPSREATSKSHQERTNPNTDLDQKSLPKHEEKISVFNDTAVVHPMQPAPLSRARGENIYSIYASIPQTTREPPKSAKLLVDTSRVSTDDLAQVAPPASSEFRPDKSRQHDIVAVLHTVASHSDNYSKDFDAKSVPQMFVPDIPETTKPLFTESSETRANSLRIRDASLHSQVPLVDSNLPPSAEPPLRSDPIVRDSPLNQEHIDAVKSMPPSLAALFGQGQPYEKLPKVVADNSLAKPSEPTSCEAPTTKPSIKSPSVAVEDSKASVSPHNVHTLGRASAAMKSSDLQVSSPLLKHGFHEDDNSNSNSPDSKILPSTPPTPILPIRLYFRGFKEEDSPRLDEHGRSFAGDKWSPSQSTVKENTLAQVIPTHPNISLQSLKRQVSTHKVATLEAGSVSVSRTPPFPTPPSSAPKDSPLNTLTSVGSRHARNASTPSLIRPEAPLKEDEQISSMPLSQPDKNISQTSLQTLDLSKLKQGQLLSSVYPPPIIYQSETAYPEQSNANHTTYNAKPSEIYHPNNIYALPPQSSSRTSFTPPQAMSASRALENTRSSDQLPLSTRPSTKSYPTPRAPKPTDWTFLVEEQSSTAPPVPRKPSQPQPQGTRSSRYESSSARPQHQHTMSAPQIPSFSEPKSSHADAPINTTSTSHPSDPSVLQAANSSHNPNHLQNTTPSTRAPLRSSTSTTRLSRAISTESVLMTPSSLAPSYLKPTFSHSSAPAIAPQSEDPRKKIRIMDMFKPKAPEVKTYEVWKPAPSTKTPQRLHQPPDVPYQAKSSSRPVRDLQPPAITRGKTPAPIAVPIHLPPASGRRSPVSKVFTPFRLFSSRRHRTVSTASLEAVDGTASTVVGSPTASMHSQNPFQPPLRDPIAAAQEWRNKEEADMRNGSGRRRRPPGVTFDLEENGRQIDRVLHDNN